MGTLGRMRGTPKGREFLRLNGHSLPSPRGPIPLVKGKCPEGTKGIGKVAPKGPDEGEYRWVQWPSNGRMGTSAPTPGYDRFRRGRCPQRPGIPPPLCGPPPFHKGGCCCASSGSLVKGSWHGAAVTEGFRTPANPPHPSCLRHATFSPAGRRR